MRFRGLKEPDEHLILSFDFWDTIVINLDPPRFRWRATMELLVKEFNLQQEVETYEIWFEKISKSIRRLNNENGHDLEFKCETAWNFLSSLIFSEYSERQRFVARSKEIFFQKALSGTKINPYFQDFYAHLINKDRIIITSDYEFGKYFLHKLLLKKGIDFPLSNIYVSSDYLASKFSGNLYRKLVYFYPNKKFIHVGDDFKSDFLVARRCGFETIYHAKLDKAIARKFRFLTSKYYAQLRKLPIRIPTFNSDINLLRSSVSQFRSYVEAQLMNGDSVYFLGSEGAFFSNAFSDEFHLNNSSRCVNLGRKEILKQIFSEDPDFVFTILLLEDFTTLEILNYMNSFTTMSRTDLFEKINYNLQKYRNSSKQDGFQKFLESIEPNTDIPGRIVTVDIGYKATFSSALSRIFDLEVIACQLLGFKTIQNSSNLAVKTLQEVKIPKYGRPFSTKYLEILLGAGPRNEFSSHPLVLEVQKEILNPDFNKSIHVLKLVKFSRLPSKKIREAIVRDRFDDLRMEKELNESTDPA